MVVRTFVRNVRIVEVFAKKEKPAYLAGSFFLRLFIFGAGFKQPRHHFLKRRCCWLIAWFPISLDTDPQPRDRCAEWLLFPPCEI